MKKATFGAGCFWGVQAAFDSLKVKTTVGYMGGNLKNPSYEDVCTDKTGHAEVVQVEYDPTQVKYENLLDVFWKTHDPTQFNRQGPDVGTQYRSVIFYHDDEQKKLALKSKKEQQKKYDTKIMTAIEPAKEFYKAEEYHQKYYLKHKGLVC
jgi:peptide-methionine (S)-S-oxide reductase